VTIGQYIRKLRTENDLSQRLLAEKANISNTEISRIESGDRQKPSPMVLKAIHTYLGVTYEDLMAKAGYIEEVIDHTGYTEKVYRDEKGQLVDIYSQAKEMHDKNSKWANLAYRVSASDLSESELEIIQGQTELLLQQFLKNRKK
jgi:transcriptional regulator with XRE-family HTH domain